MWSQLCKLGGIVLVELEGISIDLNELSICYVVKMAWNIKVHICDWLRGGDLSLGIGQEANLWLIHDSSVCKIKVKGILALVDILESVLSQLEPLLGCKKGFLLFVHSKYISYIQFQMISLCN